MTHPFEICNEDGKINVNERLNYVLGQVLGVKEFKQEQAYFLNKHRLQNRVLHGYGTVWGLDVTTTVETDENDIEFCEVQVSRGLAIDPKGREVSITKEQCANLDSWLKEKISGDNTNNEDDNNTYEVHVVLCYHPCETEQQPILGNPCRSDADNVKPTRIRDDFQLKLFTELSDKGEATHIDQLGELLTKINVNPQPSEEVQDMDVTAQVEALKTAIDNPSQVSSLNLAPIPSSKFQDILDEILCYWITNTRPKLHNRPEVESAQHDGFLLAKLNCTLNSSHKVKLDEIDGKREPLVDINNHCRPYLLHTGFLQELLATNTQAIQVATARLEELEQKPQSGPLPQVVNTSWHHDQLMTKQELVDLLNDVGLVIQFSHPIRIDSLNNRNIFLWGHDTTTLPNGEISVYIPEIQPVEVTDVKAKSVWWYVGDSKLEDEFQLVSQFQQLDDQPFTQAVRLTIPHEQAPLNTSSINFSQITVVLHGDWIVSEKILFEIKLDFQEFINKSQIPTKSRKRLEKSLEDSRGLREAFLNERSLPITVRKELKKLFETKQDLQDSFDKRQVPETLRREFIENGIQLSKQVAIAPEVMGLKWRLIDRGNQTMYIIRNNEGKNLTVHQILALDGNNIWPGPPDRPSGNGTEGGDWLSIIHIVPTITRIDPAEGFQGEALPIQIYGDFPPGDISIRFRHKNQQPTDKKLWITVESIKPLEETAEYLDIEIEISHKAPLGEYSFQVDTSRGMIDSEKLKILFAVKPTEFSPSGGGIGIGTDNMEEA
jgi:hypothetical protein